MTTNRLVSHELVQQLHRQAGEKISAERERRTAERLPPLQGEAEKFFARDAIANVIRSHSEQLVYAGMEPLPQDEEVRLQDGLFSRMYGAGPLQPLLDDDAVEDVDGIGCDEVWVTYAGGRRERLPSALVPSDEELVKLIKNLATYAGMNERLWDAANCELDLTLPGGARLSAIMSVTDRPVFSIRRHRYDKVTLGDLVGLGTMNDEAAALLDAVSRARLNMVIGGATGSGKTTLLRALATSSIDPGERIITVENTLELGLREAGRTNVVAMEAREANSEGFGEVSMAQLVRRTKRHNPDRVIVGEVLGPEIVVMLTAMMQGNDGSMSTIHARSAREVTEQIASYAQQAEGLADHVVKRMINSAIDVIVFMEKDLRTGKRRVRSIVEVAGFDPQTEVLSLTDLFSTPSGGDEAARTQFRVSEQRAEKLRVLGEWVDPLGGGGSSW